MSIILYEGELFLSKQDLHFVYWWLKVIIHFHKQTKIKMVVSYMDVVDFACMKMTWKLMFFLLLTCMLEIVSFGIWIIPIWIRYLSSVYWLFFNILNNLGLFWFWIKMGCVGVSGSLDHQIQGELEQDPGYGCACLGDDSLIKWFFCGLKME